jgi:hypothetical protein
MVRVRHDGHAWQHGNVFGNMTCLGDAAHGRRLSRGAPAEVAFQSGRKSGKFSCFTLSRIARGGDSPCPRFVVRFRTLSCSSGGHSVESGVRPQAPDRSAPFYFSRSPPFPPPLRSIQQRGRDYRGRFAPSTSKFALEPALSPTPISDPPPVVISLLTIPSRSNVTITIWFCMFIPPANMPTMGINPSGFAEARTKWYWKVVISPMRVV